MEVPVIYALLDCPGVLLLHKIGWLPVLFKEHALAHCRLTVSSTPATCPARSVSGTVPNRE